MPLFLIKTLYNKQIGIIKILTDFCQTFGRYNGSTIPYAIRTKKINNWIIVSHYCDIKYYEDIFEKKYTSTRSSFLLMV